MILNFYFIIDVLILR